MVTAVISVILIYTAFSIFLGYISHKKSTGTSSEYFIADGGVSWFHLGLTIFASWFSTFGFLGSPGFFYKKGVTWFYIQGTFCMAAPIFAWFIVRRIWLLGKEKGFITPGDLLEDRFKSPAIRKLSGIISITALLPYCLIQIVGVGKAIEVGTSGALPYWLGVLIASIGIALYTLLGGIKAIILTDVVQGTLFFIILTIGTALVFYLSGGITEGYQLAIQTRPEAFTVDTSAIGSALNLIVVWSIGYIVLPHLWQRSYMAESAESFTKGLVLFSALTFVFILAAMLIGTLSVGIIPELADSDKLLPQLFSSHLRWAVPLLVLGVFAAGMSTMDSQLLTASSVLVRDLINPLLKESLSSKKEKLVGQVFVLTFIVLLVFLANNEAFQGSIIILATKGTAICCLLFIPLLASLFSDKPNKWSAILSILIGAGFYGGLETKLIELNLPLSIGYTITSLGLQLVVFLILDRILLTNRK